MISIPEQARQKPVNATPVGWDADLLVFPAVNTCLTISALGRNGTLLGLHLGMFMGAGQEGGKGSENSTPLDADHLDMYLRILAMQTSVRGGGAARIFIAGCADMWRTYPPGLWDRITRAVNVWAAKTNATVDEPVQFDDTAKEDRTVDIYVSKSGVRFTRAGTDVAVARA